MPRPLNNPSSPGVTTPGAGVAETALAAPPTAGRTVGNVALSRGETEQKPAAMSPSTEQLLDRARRGDVEAFAAVFEQFRPLLHRLACRVVGASDGEDVVMDTYLKTWKAIPRFRGDEALRSWLCTATRNCALDYLRRRHREDERLVHDAGTTDEETPLLDRVADPRAEGSDRHAERLDLGGDLAAALRQLSPDHRATLLLREVDGLSYKEVAAATGVTIGTVMSRLFYAKYKLRKVLLKKDLRLC